MSKRWWYWMGVLVLVVTAGPVIAAPDFQQLEQNRRAQQEQAARIEKLSPEERCATKRLVLPLDHGPRAETTPWLNQQRKARFEAEVKACQDAAKASANQPKPESQTPR